MIKTTHIIPPEEAERIRAAAEIFSQAADEATRSIMEAIGGAGRAGGDFDTLSALLEALWATEQEESIKTQPSSRKPPVRPVRAVRAVPRSYRIITKKPPEARSRIRSRRNRRRG